MDSFFRIKTITKFIKKSRRLSTLAKFFLSSFVLIICILTAFLALRHIFTKNKNITAEKFESVRQYNKDILKKYSQTSNKHPFYFNDKVYPEKKDNPNTFRIIILGDSFIYGDGLEKDLLWSRILEKKLKQDHPNTEVLHWGIRGWETIHQYDFLEKEFLDKNNIYDANLILVAFVFNDPNLGNIPLRYIKLKKSKILYPFSKFFPFETFIIEDYLEKLFSRLPFLGYGYGSWESKLYSQSNLESYGTLLLKLKNFINQRDSKLLFILTPNSFSDNYKSYNEKIINILKKEKIDYFNLFPKLKERFKSNSYDKLHANALNYHPGKLLNQAYADFTNKLLKKKLNWTKIND